MRMLLMCIGIHIERCPANPGFLQVILMRAVSGVWDEEAHVIKLSVRKMVSTK